MKTNLFMALAFAFLMLFAACTEEKIIYVEKENGIEVLPGEGVIKISLSNDLQTKAARPIGSSEAANNVNRIKFYFYEHNDKLAVTENIVIDGAYDGNGDKLDNFSVDATDKSILILPDKNTIKEFSVKFESLPAEGTYTIVVYGYNCDSGSNFPYTPLTVALNGDMEYLSCENIQPNEVEEIFAGYCTTTTKYIGINQHNMFSTPVYVELKRQVAGLMAYLCNVPAKIRIKSGNDYINKAVNKITISTPVTMKGFKFPASSFSNGFNGIFSSETVFDLLTFIIPENTPSSSNGYYVFSGESGKKFLLAEGMDKNDFSDLTCKDNTLFGSCFLLPFESGRYYTNAMDEKSTLRITFYTKNENGNFEEIKRVPLKNNIDSENYSDLYNYNILCNHFYSVGGKTDVETTTDDDPLDISDETGYMDVFLTINDEWDNTLNLIK